MNCLSAWADRTGPRIDSQPCPRTRGLPAPQNWPRLRASYACSPFRRPDDAWHGDHHAAPAGKRCRALNDAAGSRHGPTARSGSECKAGRVTLVPVPVAKVWPRREWISVPRHRAHGRGGPTRCMVAADHSALRNLGCRADTAHRTAALNMPLAQNTGVLMTQGNWILACSLSWEADRGGWVGSQMLRRFPGVQSDLAHRHRQDLAVRQQDLVQIPSQPEQPRKVHNPVPRYGAPRSRPPTISLSAPR